MAVLGIRFYHHIYREEDTMLQLRYAGRMHPLAVLESAPGSAALCGAVPTGNQNSDPAPQKKWSRKSR